MNILDLDELISLQELLIERTSPQKSYASLTTTLKVAFLGFCFFSPASALLNLDRRNISFSYTGEFTNTDKNEEIVNRIASSNQAIEEFELGPQNDLATVALAYMKRCEENSDFESCMRAGIKIYINIVDGLTEKNRQIPGLTIEELKERAIWVFMVRAVNSVPNNPLYLISMALALIAEKNEAVAYGLLYRAYLKNREVAGVVNLLHQGRDPRAILGTYELLKKVLDPKANSFHFKKSEIATGEKIMLEKVTAKITEQTSSKEKSNSNMKMEL